MKPAIRVENLTKAYRIGSAGQNGYKTFRETVVDGVTTTFRRLRGKGRQVGAPTGEATHWALRNISFEVKPGEVVGLIGNNGAGKSTLLKVLSRITDPSEGRIELRGRVGSLLEIGTGFHHELTGRENIYLNGSILGMSRKEIAKKYDA